MTPRPEVTRLLRRAEAALPSVDSALRAIVLGRLARALLPPAPHELEEYRRLRVASIEMARRVGSREDVLHALSLATEGFQNLMSLEEQYALNAETIALAEELGRLASVVPLLPHQVACCLQRGDADGAERELIRAESILGRFQQPSYQWRAPLMRALLLVLRGDFAQGDALQRRALRAAQDACDRQGVLLFTIQRGTFHYVRGDAEGIDEFGALAAEVQASVPLTSLFAALEHAVAGRREEARSCLARLDPKTIDGIPGVATLGWACAEAELADLAPTFIPLVERALAAAPFIFGPAALVTTGPTELLLGRLLLLVDRVDEAEAHLLAARAFCEKLGARPSVVRADLALADIARKRRAPGAAARATAARDAARSLGMRRVAALAEALLVDAPAASTTRDITLKLTHEGPVWHLDAGTTRIVLKDTRGVAYLDELLRRPHREVHVLELAGQDESGDAGPLLDGAAKSAYRERIASIRVEIDQATADNDPGRVERLRVELEAVTGELLRAVGLHGKDRLAGSRAERARSSVQRRLRDVVKRVTEQAPALGRHLELSVKTGTFCMYAPTWPGKPEPSRTRPAE
jgi:hypothetical protein